MKKKNKQEPQHDDKEEKNKKSQIETQGDESLDTSFLQKLMQEEGFNLHFTLLYEVIERFKETLIKMNDKAVQDIQNDNCDKGLQMLERLKKVLEVRIFFEVKT